MKKKTAKMILGGCIFAFALTTFVGCAASIQAKAYTANLSQELAYSFGETFEIPDATIEYNGQEIEATKVVLVYPDGVMIEGSTHLLQAEGNYKIIYHRWYR